MHEWKTAHESRIEESLRSPSFDSRAGLYAYTRKVLAENRLIHQRFGPDTLQAFANPLSEGSIIWDLRKTTTIIPNNQRIMEAFERHRDLIPEHEWDVFLQFREHAVAFEMNTYRRLDREVVPRFPVTFANIVGGK